jgi:hypothetical protein
MRSGYCLHTEVKVEIKFLFLNSAPPLFFIGFLFFARFVSRRLPSERLSGWYLFCIGVYVAIAGLSIAVYFMQVEIGAGAVIFGAFISAVGLGKFFISR